MNTVTTLHRTVVSRHEHEPEQKQAQQSFLVELRRTAKRLISFSLSLSLYIFLLSPLLLSLSRFGSSSSSFLSKALSPVWAILRHQSVLPAVRIIPLIDRTAASL